MCSVLFVPTSRNLRHTFHVQVSFTIKRHLTTDNVTRIWMMFEYHRVLLHFSFTSSARHFSSSFATKVEKKMSRAAVTWIQPIGCMQRKISCSGTGGEFRDASCNSTCFHRQLTGRFVQPVNTVHEFFIFRMTNRNASFMQLQFLKLASARLLKTCYFCLRTVCRGWILRDIGVAAC